jgi:hypothetical protein
LATTAGAEIDLSLAFASTDEATKIIEASDNASAIIFFIPSPFSKKNKSGISVAFPAHQRESPT